MTERKKISFAHGQELSPDDAPALPLWIDGHAYLLMADRFYDVAAAGRVLRRVPLYGEDAVSIATGSTARAVAEWQALDDAARAACFRALGELLERYGTHLVRLISEETGQSPESAQAEVALVAGQLAQRVSAPMPRSPRAGIAAVLSDAEAPLAGPLVLALAALSAGWGVVLKTSPKAPSALFASAELFSRSGFPKGVVNCIHGDEDAVRALFADAAVTAAAFAGDPALADRLGELARVAGKPFAGGATGRKLEVVWQDCLASRA